MRIVSWNIKRLEEAWRLLAADPSLDVALLQEATPPPSEVTCAVVPLRDSECRWTMPGYKTPFRTAVACLSDRVSMHPRGTAAIGHALAGEIPVSRNGSLAAADIVNGDERITCISAYSAWENVSSGPDAAGTWIISDASAHRLISDISTLIATQRGHKIIVAGDFNLLHGHGDHGSAYWKRRYQTVFDRMETLGLRFVGPQAPNGRQADPWPAELPPDSKNVPTFHASQQTPASATRQLDFVFVSESLAPRTTVRAINMPEEWGPSDHCRVVIDVG